MLHYGDVTKIKGSEVPIVDIITFGAPCQDLSVAGKRAGMKHEALGDGETTRSGLFFEAIRIIKEMREHDRRTNTRTDEHIRPRYAVYENVPGAFSSNKGADFQAVLEETAKIVCKDAVIPMPEGGKWSPSGCVLGDGWSIAWRVHDAQFWGVPQRRKRIALVADFGGTTAPEILFERESVSGNLEQSEQQREEVARTVGESVDPSSYTLKIRGGVERDSSGKKAGKGPLIQTELSGTLGVSQDQTLITKADVKPLGFNRERCGAVTAEDVMPTIQAAAGESGNNQPMVCFEPGAASRVNSWTPKVVSIDEKMGQTYIGEEVGNTLGARDYKQPQAVVYGLCSDGSNAMKSSNPHSGIYEADTTRTLDLNGGNPACNQGGMAVVQAAGLDGYNQTMDVEVIQPLRCAEGGDSTPKVVCFEGNGQRESHKGDGFTESDVMYTLNTVEKHGICTYQDTTGSLMASGYDKLGTQEAMNDMYVVQGSSWDGSQVSPTLTSNNAGGGQRMPDKENFNAVIQPMLLESNQDHATVQTDGISTTLPASMGMGGGYVPMVTYGVDCYNQTQSEEVAQPLRSINADNDHIPCVYGLDRASFNQGQNAQYDFSVEEEKAQTLVAKGPGGAAIIKQ